MDYIKEAFNALLKNDISSFQESVGAALRIKLADKFKKIEPDTMAERFNIQEKMAAGERRFVDMHTAVKHLHPVAPEDTFTSDKTKMSTAIDSEMIDNDLIDGDEVDPNSTNELMKSATIRGQS